MVQLQLTNDNTLPKMLLALLLLPLLLGVSAKEDPEQHMTTPEMVRFWGYPAEEHWVTTSDEYILGIHRIPGKEGALTNALSS